MNPVLYRFTIEHSDEVRAVLEGRDVWFNGNACRSFDLIRFKPSGGIVHEGAIRLDRGMNIIEEHAALSLALEKQFRQKKSLSLA